MNDQVIKVITIFCFCVIVGAASAGRFPAVGPVSTIDLEQGNQKERPFDAKKTSFDFSTQDDFDRDAYRFGRFKERPGRFPQSEVRNTSYSGRSIWGKDLALIVLLLLIPFSSIILINRKLLSAMGEQGNTGPDKDQ